MACTRNGRPAGRGVKVPTIGLPPSGVPLNTFRHGCTRDFVALLLRSALKDNVVNQRVAVGLLNRRSHLVRLFRDECATMVDAVGSALATRDVERVDPPYRRGTRRHRRRHQCEP